MPKDTIIIEYEKVVQRAVALFRSLAMNDLVSNIFG
jgi:hypothetical protein